MSLICIENPQFDCRRSVDERRYRGFPDATIAPNVDHSYVRVVEAEGDAPLTVLVENQRAFLRYLEGRVGDRALAEDILQEAFARVVARRDQAPRDEGVVPWFYRPCGMPPLTSSGAAVPRIRGVRARARSARSTARGAERRDRSCADRRGPPHRGHRVQGALTLWAPARQW